jgi:hypothetical protein
MAHKRFEISADGKELKDLKDGTSVSIAKFSLSQYAGNEIVLFNIGLKDKKQMKINRKRIDESKFSFGKSILGPKKRDITGEPPTHVEKGDENAINFTKQELLELHEAHLNATNMTLRKLAAHIKAVG